MTRFERAVQLWPLLTFCATQRHVLNYDIAAKLTGVPRPALGGFLEPVQSYCLLKQLPPLSSIVVGGQTGIPGEGFIAAADVPSAQAAVFNRPWLNDKPPTVAELEESVRQLPSNGKSLSELKRQITSRAS